MDITVEVASGSWTIEVADNTFVDITLYEHIMTNRISMDVWEGGNHVSLASYERTYVKWTRILPKTFALALYKWQIKHHQRKLNNELRKRGYILNINVLKEGC